LVTTRILNQRRQAGLRTRREAAAPSRRRRSARPVLLRIAAHLDAVRLRLGVFAKVYVLAAATILVTVAYLGVSASTTSLSYQQDTLQAQQQQLREQQQQLSYQEAMLHTPAKVAVAAQQQGMKEPSTWSSLPYQPATFDVNAPIGQAPANNAPAWQQLGSAIVAELAGAVHPRRSQEAG
jgi:cell division protein FtsL